jgi:hypothetical protein
MPALPDQHAGTQNDHNGPADQEAQEVQGDLEKLAAELSTRGFKTVLAVQEGRLPNLDVLTPDAAVVSERVYAQADFFWWPWAQVIDRRDQIPAAADAIARALCTGIPQTAGE